MGVSDVGVVDIFARFVASMGTAPRVKNETGIFSLFYPIY